MRKFMERVDNMNNKKQKFDLILINNLSTITRSMIDLYDLVNMLKTYNCKLKNLYGQNMENLMYLRFSTRDKAKTFYQIESRDVK